MTIMININVVLKYDAMYSNQDQKWHSESGTHFNFSEFVFMTDMLAMQLPHNVPVRYIEKHTEWLW